jgi:O-antigen/teichoic acid export membrane protein
MTTLEYIRRRLPLAGALSGGALLLASTTVVNGGNYLSNLVLGRWLGPAQFAEFSLLITLTLVASFVTTGIQQTVAKFAATHFAAGEAAKLAGLRVWLRRLALGAGTVIMLIMALGAPLWARFFRMSSPWLFVLLAVGMPVYFLQSVDRGILQGRTVFGQLAASYQAEMWTRLLVALGLVVVGFGVFGAIGGVVLSFAATWLVVREKPSGDAPAYPTANRRQVAAFALPVIVAEVSQILINNSDVLIVKHLFTPEEAGLYAALALIGRMVFYGTWAVVVVMFPIVSQKQARGEGHRHLLLASLGIVGLLAAGIVGVTAAAPDLIVGSLFGPAYLAITDLLWLYAVATTLYALANVIITYHLSLGQGQGTLIALAAGVAQVIGVALLHDSLRQVVLVQIGVMGALLLTLLAWDGLLVVSRKQPSPS